MTYTRICCPHCDQTFGQEVRFFGHLTDIHGISDHLALYLETHCNGNHPKCQCSSECPEKLPWAGWKKGFTSKYARGHNARVDSIYLDPKRQEEFAAKRIKGYEAGKYTVWNKGLNKSTDIRVAVSSEKISKTLRRGYESGDIIDWRLKDPERASAASEKISKTKKKKFASGEIVPWNLGLTKSISASLQRSSDSIKAHYFAHPESSPRRHTPEHVVTLIEDSKNFDLLDDPTCYRNKYQKLRMRCKTCGAVQLKNIMMLTSTPVCFSCAPKESRGQLEVYDFVKSLSPDALLSDRSLIAPQEVDILVPKSRLAVEYNGLYWHSTAVLTDKMYHERKRRSIAAAGHKFLMIFEDEWRDRRHLIEGMLRHRLQQPMEVLDARRLTVERLNSKVSSAFFNSSHLEGSTPCAVSHGLVDGSGRLVAAMSLRRPFHASRAAESLEVARSATLPGVSIRGWLGRLTAASRRAATELGARSLISYVDARVGDGASYLAAGWVLEKSPGSPRFWWTNYQDRFNRFKYKADRGRGMSQEQVASEAGVVEIWGCSNYVMRLDT